MISTSRTGKRMTVGREDRKTAGRCKASTRTAGRASTTSKVL